MRGIFARTAARLLHGIKIMNTGLTLDQFREIVEFARAFHEYGKFYDEGERTAIKMLYPKWRPLDISYIGTIYDINSGFIHSLIITHSREKVKPFYQIDSGAPLFDRVMAYLKGGDDETV